MGIPVGSTYTSTIEATFVRRFTCAHCGFESLAKVRSKGEGQGTSPLWLREQGAKDAASAEALQKAEEAADELVALGTCPSCDRRNESALSSLQTSAWMGGVGLGALVALALSATSLGVPIGVIVGAVVALMYVHGRAWRWSDIDERVRVLKHSEVEALLGEHGVDDEADAA